MATLLAGRYEPIEVVGRGAEGEVVRAWDGRHGRSVALKMRSLEGLSEEDALAEARLLLQLRPHPSLPIVRDDFTLDDRHILVMDWVDGRSLQDVLDERGPLSLEHVIRLLSPVAAALDHLHGHQPPVVHGDVKPANVVVGHHGEVVLVDFGIAGRVGTAGGGYGTGGYMAPEIGAGRRLSPAADVFSLAATAFALLTGAAPRPGARPPWRSLTPDQVRTVEAALRRGLALDPSRRHGRASELIAALAGAVRPPTNLPRSLTTFVGRSEELAEVADLLTTARLLTLTGPGGVGKTRLAVEVAAAVLDGYPDGVFWIELAPLQEASVLGRHIAQSLGLIEEQGIPHEETVLAWLSGRRALLVLDNCEHLIDVVAEFLEGALRQAAHLKAVATSREPLRIPGETAWRVPSLPGADAVHLFVERAQAVQPAFGENGATVAEICARLDRLPLVIELAAGRMASVSPAELLRRLDDRFGLLSRGARTAPRRHQTLRAMVDGSYEALAPAEQVVFDRLAVFAGGFSLDAAEAVCGEAAVADALWALTEKSLLVADVAASGTRYRLLETLRAYAEERLAARGQVEAVRDRHLDWYVRTAEEAWPQQFGPAIVEFLGRFKEDHANIRAALRWSLDGGSPQMGLRLVRAQPRFWTTGGRATEGLDWLRRLLAAAPDVPARLRAEALGNVANLAFVVGERDLQERAGKEALDLYRALEDDAGTAEGLLAAAPRLASDWETVRSNAERALELWRRALARPPVDRSFEWREAIGWRIHVHLGNAAFVGDGDLVRARDHFDTAVALQRQHGDLHALAQGLAFRGRVSLVEGKFAEARAFLEESLALAERLDLGRFVAMNHNLLGRIALAQGDIERAGELHREAVLVAARFGARSDVVVTVEEVAALVAHRGDWRQWTRLVASTREVRKQLGMVVDRRMWGMYEPGLLMAKQSLGGQGFAEAWEEGCRMSLEQAVAVATACSLDQPAASSGLASPLK